jgi:integrase
MAKPTPGLRKRGNFWHIEKVIAGQPLCESTKETSLENAERYLAKRIATIKNFRVYGELPKRTFDEAAARYIDDDTGKKSLPRDIVSIKAVFPYIGNLALESVHAGTLDRFVSDRQAAGISAGTIRRDLSVVRQILKLACLKWREPNGEPWLKSVPMMPSVKGEKPRQARPITHEEQARLFPLLPDYLAEMALFAVHTGCRDQEICGLQWAWEHKVNGDNTTVFILPGNITKNGKERIIPLNAVARSIVEARRQVGGEHVFSLNGKRLQRMNNRAWQQARIAAGMPSVRVHDLRHTFGNRLRYAGVSYEDRQDLLGHHAGRITSHYCKADIYRLIEAVELLTKADTSPTLQPVEP